MKDRRPIGIVAAGVGIDSKIVERFRAVCEQNAGKNACVHVVTEMKDFTRSGARNLGILQLLDTCGVIVCVDIDMLVPPKLVEYTRRVVQDGVAVWAKCRNLPSEQVESKDWDKWLKIPVREAGTGSWIAMTSADWLRLGGWDERITTYGGEDDVLQRRREEAGIVTVETPVFPLMHVNHGVRQHHGRKTGPENIELCQEEPTENYLTGRRWQLDDWNNHFNIFVTTRCTRNCPECSQRGFRFGQPEYQLSLDQLQAWIDATKASGYRKYTSVILTGGEPLLWPHLEDAAEMLQGADVAEQINVFSNADRVERVSDRLMDAITVLRLSHYGDNAKLIKQTRERYGEKIVSAARRVHYAIPLELGGPECLPAKCGCQGPAMIGETILGCAMLVTVANEFGIDLGDFPESQCPVQPGYIELLAGFPRTNHACCRGCISNPALRKKKVGASA